jgi:hypothetical protein
MTADMIFSIYCVNIRSFCDKKCIFVSIIVITLSFCNVSVYYCNKGAKKIICLIYCKMESNFDGYDGLSDIV